MNAHNLTSANLMSANIKSGGLRVERGCDRLVEDGSVPGEPCR